MGQVSKYLRRGSGGYLCWCPACSEPHQLPNNGWTFDGNLESPTFTPSFKISDSRGAVCHFTLKQGILHYTHGWAGRVVPLPELPPEFCDPCDWSDG